VQFEEAISPFPIGAGNAGNHVPCAQCVYGAAEFEGLSGEASYRLQKVGGNGVGNGEVIVGNGSPWGRCLSISIPESPFPIGNGRKLNYFRASPS
jgi:hypothetical protein